VRQVADELHQENPDRRVDIRVGDLPDCRGDRVLLKQVVRNLLSNAVKFTARSPSPLIAVQADRRATEIVYTVEDNGAGFDMDSADRLFGVFQRLHSSSAFPGTGIGLSIVRRIVERHGGKAWAEGEVDRGARFHFSLPSDATSSA
jgi:light-regulated signal transduction histidine kinase (bacteriophytochrome)